MTVLGQGAAKACSCAAGSLDDSVKNADIIFYGAVLSNSIENCASGTKYSCAFEPFDQITEFHVKTAYKGTLGPIAFVKHQLSDGMCGFKLKAFENYTIFAKYNRAGELESGICQYPTYDVIEGLPSGETLAKLESIQAK